MEQELSPSDLELLKFLEDLQQNNPAEYEQMQQQLAAAQAARGAQGGSVTVMPTAGFVAKTRSVTGKGRKVFVNLCTSDLIDPCSEMDPEGPQPAGAPPPTADEYRIRIPVSVGPPREDLDKSNEACTVYDVVFNPTTVDSAQTDKGFRAFMMQVVASQIAQKHGDELSADFTFPKVLGNYKGISPLPQFIRAAAKPPAAEGGGFAPDPPPPRAAPIIEELPSSREDADAAAATLPAPAYVLRPLRADGTPLDDADDEQPGVPADERAGSGDALGRAPARLELKVHLPALAAGGTRARSGGAGAGAGAGAARGADASALERISVRVSAWDVRVLVTDLYALALELPCAVDAAVEDACLELERSVLSVTMRALGADDASKAAVESAASHEASKAQAEAWEAQLSKEARARKARQLLDQRRKEAAMEKAAADAQREATEAAARVESERARAAREDAPAADCASMPSAARGAGVAQRPPAVPPIALTNAVMFELE
ncbi:hypothetical protein KFE25_010331 [Diacronema lutheri]|uniref:PIH1 N-terminal domain-containing protein n=3 Tax=Diacronema lutheri TaxID=2081491 RepID=A0A8J5X707_DIALT|nr:hypothetical protein KFE25_010331 [Diacronema lutheri]